MASFLVKHAKLVIAFILILTGLAGWQAINIGRDMDFINYLPKGSGDIEFFKEVQSKFGTNYTVMAIVEAPETVYDIDFLTKGRALQDAFDKINGIGNILSLYNAIDIRKTYDGMEVGELMPKIPENEQEVMSLRERVDASERLSGILVSRDHRFAVFLLRLTEDAKKDLVSEEIINAGNKLFEEDHLYYAGVPVVMLTTSQMTESGMMTLIPLVLLVMILILSFGFRSVRGVVLPLIVMLSAVSLTMGLMTILDVPMTMISSILPVVLIAVGSAYAIHMLNRYGMIAKTLDDPKEVAIQTMKEMWIPVGLASFTTFFGFASLVSATLRPIREFGVFTAIGTAIALGLALTLLPALLSLMKVKAIGQGDGEEETGGRGAALGIWVYRNAGKIVIVAVLMLTSAAVLIPNINQEMNMLSFFPEDSKVRQSDRVMTNKFGGSQPFVIDFKGEDALDPVNGHLILGLQKWLRGVEHVNNPQSVIDVLTDMYDVMNGVPGLPASIGEVEGLWVLLDGKSSLDSLITKDRTELVIQGQLDIMATKLVDKIRLQMLERVDDLKGEWHYASLSELPADQVPVFLEQRAAMTVEWLQLDAQSRLGQKLPKDTLTAVIQNWNKTSTSMQAFLAAISQATTVFWKGNEIELTEAESNGINKGLAALSTPISAVDILAVLESSFPKEQIIDEEDLSFFSDNLALSLSVLGRVQVAKAATQQLVGMLEGVDIDKDSRKAMVQDLYLLTSPSIPSRTLPGRTVMVNPRVTGYPFVMSENNKQLLIGQLQSIATAIVFVLILLIIQLRSVFLGLLAIVPIVSTVTILFGTMSFFGIVLDTGTAMIAAITIGTGIDYTIHVINRFRIEMRERGNLETAIPATLDKIGTAVMLNALSVGVGFLVLIASDMVPMQWFGALMCLGMILSSVGALTLFPALLKILNPKALYKNGQSVPESQEN